jgi:hypothetical protein
MKYAEAKQGRDFVIRLEDGEVGPGGLLPRFGAEDRSAVQHGRARHGVEPVREFFHLFLVFL